MKKLPCSYNNNADMLKMVNVVEKAWIDLESLGQESELYNGTTISIIEQAMNPQMKHEWVRLIASKSYNSKQKFGALLEFLRDWRNRLEYIDEDIREEPIYNEGDTYHVGGQHQKERSRQSEKKKSRARCWFHNVDGEAGDHPIWECRAFQRKPVQERQDLVKINKACKRCLLVECPGGATSTGECCRDFICLVPGCGGEHNRLLHSKDGKVLHAHEADACASGDTILPIQKL